MSQIKQEQVAGLVRNEVKKGDEGREKPYTALMADGSRKQLDAGEAASLQKRLDKDRSRMERDGTREPERERERRAPNKVASREDRDRFLSQFKKG